MRLLEVLRRLTVRLMLRMRAALLRRLLPAIGLWLLSRRIRRLLIAEVLRVIKILLTAKIWLILRWLILYGLTHLLFAAVEGVFTVAFTRRWRRLVERVLLPELLLRRRDQTGIVLSVLEVVFSCDRVARCLRVAGELKVFLRNVVSRSSDLHLRAIRLVDPG